MNTNFIPYTEALALNELGFDEECLAYYKNNDKLIVYYTSKPSITQKVIFDNYNGIKALLYQEAFKFFRNKYKLSSHCDLKNISHIGNNYYFKIINFSDYISEDNILIVDGFTTYEEAELEGLKKLIELCNT
jgi:hypothetical protein